MDLLGRGMGKRGADRDLGARPPTPNGHAAARALRRRTRPTAAGAPLPIALDFHLEGRGRRTVLRLVHSGFGAGAEWDDEVDGVSRGWAFELHSLRHYVTRHMGRPCRAAWSHATTDLPVAEVWARLLAGVVREGRLEGLTEGDRYRAVAATGDVLSGGVVLSIAPYVFAGTAEVFGDGLFRLAVDKAGGRTLAQVWLSAWTADEACVDAFREGMQQALDMTPGAPATSAGSRSH